MAKTGELRDEERAIVKNLSVKGLSTREISRIIGCHFPTVSRILKKFKTEGTVQKSRRSGRPKKIDPSGERMVTRVAKWYRCEQVKCHNRRSKQTLSWCKCIKTMSKMNFTQVWDTQPCKEKKTVCLFGKQKKVYPLVESVERLAGERLGNVAFSDECRFSLSNDNKTMRVWRSTVYCSKIFKFYISHVLRIRCS